MSKLKEQLIELTKLRYSTWPILMQTMKVDTVHRKDDLTDDQDDHVAWILRCHLLSEVILDKLIELALQPNGNAILSLRLSYNKKLDLISKCVLSDDYELVPEIVIQSLKKLNKIRNRLAHELGATVTQQDVIDLFMGIEHITMPDDPINAPITELIYQYTPFIFGCMLPKYEFIETENEFPTK
jgi:hypothetical protein